MIALHSIVVHQVLVENLKRENELKASDIGYTTIQKLNGTELYDSDGEFVKHFYAQVELSRFLKNIKQ